MGFGGDRLVASPLAQRDWQTGKASPKWSGCLLAMLVASATGYMVPDAAMSAIDNAEILYVVELDEASLRADADDAAAAWLPEELAVALTEAFSIDVYLSEPVAAIPYPSVVVSLVAANGDHVDSLRLEYDEDYTAAGVYRFGLPSGTAAALTALIRGAHDGMHSVEDIGDLGYFGGEAQLARAVSEPARMLAERRAADADDSGLYAISVIAVPRTVETFVADAGKGGGFMFALRYESP
jgi:hypothetical protein